MRPARLPRRLTGLAVSLLATLLVLGALPAPVGASTADDMASLTISWINRDRVARGLVPLRADSRLSALAKDRATRMAQLDVMSHEAAGGNVGTALTSRGIQWYSYGEVIGWSTYSWGSPAASSIYSMWMASSSHRPLLMSGTYNYVGAGFAYRSANRRTYASVILTESADHTRPGAAMVSGSRSGTTVVITWRGWDPRLQTHTAGLRSFDVQYRVDAGPWKLVRDDTTYTKITLRDRARGHWYGIRVQSADRRGNLSVWTRELRVWVP